MRYIALLRGINVGGNRKVGMKELRAAFEKMGYSDVSTYINSGNVIFESKTRVEKDVLEKALKKTFGFDIPTLVKSERDIQKIGRAIPPQWQNDTQQKTDVAYLFDAIDSKTTVDEMPMNRDYVDIRYTKGALIWNVSRKNYGKSRLNKLIGSKLYQSMTIRNVNTARFLAGLISTTS